MKNRGIIFLFFFISFIIVSFLFISPAPAVPKSTVRSTELKKTVEKNDNQERTDYKDDNGVLTIAADLGYATKVVTYNSNEQLEQYYDEKGEPIATDSGYFAIHRTYDDRGNAVRITYLGEDRKPVPNTGCYAIEERVFNDKNEIILVRYCDTEGNQVCSRSYGYAKRNEYDENGNVSGITFLDQFGEPMMTRLGYAKIKQLYYPPDSLDKNRIEYEFYFDENDQPVSLSLGQYGVHKEYNREGLNSALIYLDAKGNPLVTTKGYTRIERTFYADKTIATEKYYDLNGKPFALSEGQYGIKRDGGQTTFINENGSEVFNVRGLLYKCPQLVIICSLFLILLSSVLGRKTNLSLMLLYIGIIGYMTLMYRDTTDT